MKAPFNFPWLGPSGREEANYKLELLLAQGRTEKFLDSGKFTAD
jgi:hypothetical protein